MAYGATKDVENAQADADEAALAAALGKRQGALKVVAIGLVAAAFVLGYVAAPAGRRTATAFSSLTCDKLPDCKGCVKIKSGGLLCKKKTESECKALKNSAWCPATGAIGLCQALDNSWSKCTTEDECKPPTLQDSDSFNWKKMNPCVPEAATGGTSNIPEDFMDGFGITTDGGIGKDFDMRGRYQEIGIDKHFMKDDQEIGMVNLKDFMKDFKMFG